MKVDIVCCFQFTIYKMDLMIFIFKMFSIHINKYPIRYHLLLFHNFIYESGVLAAARMVYIEKVAYRRGQREEASRCIAHCTARHSVGPWVKQTVTEEANNRRTGPRTNGQNDSDSTANQCGGNGCIYAAQRTLLTMFDDRIVFGLQCNCHGLVGMAWNVQGVIFANNNDMAAAIEIGWPIIKFTARARTHPSHRRIRLLRDIHLHSCIDHG